MAQSLIHAQAERLIQSLDLTSSPKLDVVVEIKYKTIKISKLLLVGGYDGKQLEELRDVLYDVDDLLDEIASTGGSSFCGVLFRVSIHLSIATRFYKLAHKLDHLIHTLGTCNNVNNDNKVLEPEPELELESVIVGRENDKQWIFDLMNLGGGGGGGGGGYGDGHGVCFISIVGMGGLGKTALAQLVFEDDKIVQEFPLRMWVCLSDFGFDLDLKWVISKLLNSVSSVPVPVPADLGLSQLKGLLKDTLVGNKYLLVLDNVWSEDPAFWVTFKHALFETGGDIGSTVLVTTRSAIVPQAIGNCVVFELKGLSEADSWKLFSMVAFRGLPDNETLVNAGKRILKKCANVPLAIMVVGSLLYAQGSEKWMQIDRACLLEIDQYEKRVIPVLKLSFDQLSSPLKSCFAFCCLFPKGDLIDKKNLISLWMAHGYLHPVGSQSLEQVGEECFMALLQKSFFQGVRVDLNGEIASCKIHDLMHDLALAVAGDEFQLLTRKSSTVDVLVRHLSISDMEGDFSPNTCLPRSKGIHTLLNFSCSTFTHLSSISNSFQLKHLRVLGLESLDVACLPHFIGELCHLRYLNLSYNPQLECLPSSVVKLVNLQSLVLKECLKLKYLPREISKLVNLRLLDIQGCNRLTHMPLGLRNLSSLCKLDMFVVGDANSVCSFDSLEDLKSLTKLRGALTLKFLELPGYHAVKSRETEYLRAKEHLTDIYIHFIHAKTLQQTDDKNCEALLKCLEPHTNVKRLVLEGYAGVRFPSWVSLKSSKNTCSYLVNLCIEDCPRLQHLPILSKLCHLRHLKLSRLEDLQYVESDSKDFDSQSGLRYVESQSFFASLESLKLGNLPKLRGWSRLMELHMIKQLTQDRDVISGLRSFPAFPRLCQLNIEQCPKLTSLPICENIKQLHLYRFNDALQLIISHNSQQQRFSPLTRVTIDNVGYLKFLPAESYEHISSFIINSSDIEWVSMNDVFDRDMLSLQSLEIRFSGKLKSILGLGWNHLVALQSLRLSNLPNLRLSTMTADGEEDLMPWNSLQGLRHLELDYLPKLMKLPKGIQYLTILRTFEIRSCHNLKELPEWIGCLNELQSLYIVACTGLKCLPESMLDLIFLRNLEIRRCSGFLIEKCRQADGEDWPKIQHIPHFTII